jgi:hypothetical protein
MKLTVALLAVTAAVVVGSAAAAPPSPTVTCVAGGTTSFAHPPHGTDSVMFTYSAPPGGLVAFFTWVSGARRAATPTPVAAGDSVVAAFFNGQTQIDSVTATCS